MAAPPAPEPLTVEHAGDFVVVRLPGPRLLGDNDRELLRERLPRLAEELGGRRVWLDFAEVAAVDGSVLSMLVVMLRRTHDAGGRLVVANVRPGIREVLAVTRLDFILDVRDGFYEEGPAPPDPAREAFLRAVIEEPDDDVHRLVYADWLEERAEAARAELIRLQCRLARAGTDDPGRPALERRERELLAGHGAEWARPLRHLVARWAFHRGFVEEVMLSRAALLDHADELPGLAPVRRLRLRPGWPRAPSALPVLLGSPLLPRLTLLDLHSNGIGDPGALALAASPGAAGLGTLELSNNQVGDEGALALASSPWLRRLTALDLRGNAHVSEGARAALRERFGRAVSL